ncbi:MAG: iron dicitrate transport regulator FecR [Phycisphaerales bacterium]|nr:iron dicitrate transport regulator FecR [Phycisphaerales bacterium]MCB9862101.1 iron dicitrate transport regulator FecR [Phycisphaerales bacterium]
MNAPLDNEALNIAAWHLREAKRVVVFSGAGVSAESGIPTFRDDGGFWTEFPPEIYATWNGILRAATKEPRRLAAFVHAVIAPIADAEPNPAHRAIAEVGRRKPVTVVTQNIDRLHQRAGSTRVLEVHGSMYEVVSLNGKKSKRTLTQSQLKRIAERVRRAKYGVLSLARLLVAIRPIAGVGITGAHRPNLVLFGDSLAEPDWSDALKAAKECDCLLSVGTSGLVLPAAMIPAYAKDAGANVITIDPGEGGGDIWLRGKAGDILPRLVARAFD